MAETLETNIVGYIDGLYTYAVALTCNRDDAGDVVEETYVRDSLTAKACTILRNVWLNKGVPGSCRKLYRFGR